jgi:hypothetical protein
MCLSVVCACLYAQKSTMGEPNTAVSYARLQVSTHTLTCRFVIRAELHMHSHKYTRQLPVCACVFTSAYVRTQGDCDEESGIQIQSADEPQQAPPQRRMPHVLTQRPAARAGYARLGKDVSIVSTSIQWTSHAHITPSDKHNRHYTSTVLLH